MPPEREAGKKRFYRHMRVVAVRCARDGERMNAWRSLLWPGMPWEHRLSLRYAVVVLMLLTSRPFWLWALHYKR